MTDCSVLNIELPKGTSPETGGDLSLCTFEDVFKMAAEELKESEQPG